MFKKYLLLTLAFGLCASPAALADTPLKAGIVWDETKARQEALKNIERQIDVQFFKAKDAHFFENIKLREQNPNLTFVDRQITFFSGGEYAVVYQGEKNVHYYTQAGDLFKVSVCDLPFRDEWQYPRRCIEYGYPSGKFLTISMDVSPEESYIFALDGNLLYHWKDEQGFDAHGNTVWERWNDRETIEKEQRQKTL